MNFKLIEVFLISVASMLVIFTIYLAFVILPVSLYADAKCLEQGFPNSHVTIGLETYCSNFDGSITIKVIKQ